MSASCFTALGAVRAAAFETGWRVLKLSYPGEQDMPFIRQDRAAGHIDCGAH
jgi:hypothetical protein